MKNYLKYALFGTAMLFICSTVALADPFTQPGSSTSPQPFTVTCDPYTAPFVSGVNYMPDTGGSCTYTVPQVGAYKFVGIYKGVPGNSVPVQRGFVISNPSSVLIDSGYDFSSAQIGDNYFAASFSSNDINAAVATDSYLTSGSGAATADLTTLQFVWGETPPVSVSVPTPGGSYASTATVIPLANIANLISYTSVTYFLNGTQVDASQPLPLANFPAGPATFVIAATDSFGNTVYGTSTFIIADILPPVITINKPQDGHSYLQNDMSSVDAVVTDNVAVATTTYMLDGVLIDPSQMLPFASLSLGSHVFVVSAVDTAGNSASATSTFTLQPADLTAPVVTITSPTAGATYTDSSNLYLTSTITDSSAIAASTFTFNGVSIDPAQPLPLIGAPLGPATVSVSATDIYGNAASSTLTFTLKSSDVTPPSITITNPVAGHSYLSNASVIAAATISDASGVATTVYTLDSIAVNPSVPLPLNLAGNGPATLVVTATDNFGNATSSSVSFTVTAPPPPDTTGPSITIVSPYPGKKYSRNDDVAIVANITDASTISNVRYYFNGKLVTNPAAKIDFNKAPLGYNTLQVIATDIYGNVGSSTSKFRIMPGTGTCIADITEAFDRKWIANKNAFKEAYEDCQRINDRGHDRDNYRDDNYRKHRNNDDDDRYKRAQKDIDDCFDRLDSRINN